MPTLLSPQLRGQQWTVDSEVLDARWALVVGTLNLGLRTVGSVWPLEGFEGKETHKTAR